MITIVIPTFNRTEFLEDAIDSVLVQNFTDWESIIVDDGSNEDSIRHIQQIVQLDKRIRFIKRTRSPKGAATCRNLGWQSATGKYIIFLDSDDLLAPHCLGQRVKTMEENPELDFAVFPMEQFAKKPGDLKKLWNIETAQKHLDRFLRLDAVWQTSGPIWKKEAIQKIDGFDEKLTCWQDIDIHLNALFAELTYRLFYELPPDCYYRRHQSGSISQSNINSVEKLQSRSTLYFRTADQLGDETEKVKSMALSIVYSTIITLRFRFAYRFIRKCRQRFSVLHYLGFCLLGFVYFSRLYKFPGIRSFVHKNIFNTGAEIHIGKHASS